MTIEAFVAYVAKMAYNPQVTVLGEDRVRVVQSWGDNNILDAVYVVRGPVIVGMEIRRYVIEGVDCSNQDEGFEPVEWDSYVGYVTFDAVFG